MLVNDMVAHADDVNVDAEAVATIHPDNWACSEQFLGMSAAYADIVFLSANPVDDFDYLRDVRLVVVDGRAHDPGALTRRARNLLDAAPPGAPSAR